MIELGQKVRDIVTGLEGIAVSRIEYLNGCIQYGIETESEDGNKLNKTEYLDEGRLKVIDSSIVTEQLEEKEEEEVDNGGVMHNAPRGGYGRAT